MRLLVPVKTDDSDTPSSEAIINMTPEVARSIMQRTKMFNDFMKEKDTTLKCLSFHDKAAIFYEGRFSDSLIEEDAENFDSKGFVEFNDDTKKCSELNIFLPAMNIDGISVFWSGTDSRYGVLLTTQSLMLFDVEKYL